MTFRTRKLPSSNLACVKPLNGLSTEARFAYRGGYFCQRENDLSSDRRILSRRLESRAQNPRARARAVSNVFAFLASRGAIHIPVSTRSKSGHRPASPPLPHPGFSLSYPLSGRRAIQRAMVNQIHT